MSRLPTPAAIVYAARLEPMARFYEQVLAWPVLQADDDHVRLGSEHLELVIHAIPAHIVATFAATLP